MKLAAAYLRRSTDDKQADSIDIQRMEIEKYADENDYRIVAWYIDDGISGHDEDRSDFVRMINDCENGAGFDYILVRHQSRFGRFRPATTIAYLDRIDRHGVRLVTTKQGIIDIDNLAEYLMASIEAETDHKFSKTLSELTIRGQVQTATKGRSAGQLAPFGYDRMYIDESGKPRQRVKNGEKYAKPKSWKVVFVPSDDPEKVEIVQQVFDSFVNGKGYPSIAGELNQRGIPAPKGGDWHQGTIRAMLKNPIYCGDFRWNKTRQGKFHSRQEGETQSRSRDEVAPAKSGRRKHRVYLNDESDWIITVNAHPAIVSRRLWEIAQEIMDSNSRGNNRKGRPPVDDRNYLLKGLCHCSHCGHKMHGTKVSRKKNGKTYVYRKYICSGYSCRRVCDHNAAVAEELHEIVVREVIAALRSPRNVDAIRKSMEIQSQIDATGPSIDKVEIQAKLAQVNKELDAQIIRLGRVPEELVDAVIKRSTELKEEQTRLEQELASIEPVTVSEPQQWTADDVVELLNQVADNLEQCPADKLQAALHQLIERVELQFVPKKYGKKTIQRLSGGIIHLKKVVGNGMAGTRYARFCNIKIASIRGKDTLSLSIVA